MTTATKPRGGKQARRTQISGSGQGPQIPADGRWPKSVCDYMRRLSNGLKRSESAIAKAIKDRDALDEQIAECGDRETRRKQELCEQWHESIKVLEANRKQVKWYGQKLTEAVDGADQGELFENAKTKPTEEDLLFKGPPKNAWKKEPIESDKSLEDRVIAALKAAEITTWGDVDKRTEPFERIEGLNVSDIAAIQAGLDRARKGGSEPLGDEDDE